MRNKLVCVLLIFSTLAYSQDEFIYTEDGLSPKYISYSIKSNSKADLYKKTLQWIGVNFKHPDKVINIKNENDFIQFSNIKENTIDVGKQYYHVKYTIKISYKDGQYKFEPLKIQSKLNSKYDMGWVDFDLQDGSSLFKKGRVIKKYKSYVITIPDMLNELNTNFYNYLVSGK